MEGQVGGAGERRPVSGLDPPAGRCPVFSVSAGPAGRAPLSSTLVQTEGSWPPIHRSRSHPLCDGVGGGAFGGHEVGREAPSALGTGCGEPRPLHQVRTQVVWMAGRGPQRHLGRSLHYSSERLVLAEGASE